MFVYYRMYKFRWLSTSAVFFHRSRLFPVLVYLLPREILLKMFRKLALLALVTPLVSALTLHIPDNIRTSQPVTITWDTVPGDPYTFTLELTNEEFHDQFALVNNIDPNQGSVTFTVPVVPVRGGYTLEAVNVGNIGDVYSKTGQFSVGETFITGSSSSSSTTRTGTSTTGSTSTTGTGTTSRSTT
ncbi:hypothetical protein DFP72DRAFT_37965 [Ephemerocybe angulata]|nr:hypothetical protein DFP72DRAFT_37965 [Tulosesus angulatus]